MVRRIREFPTSSLREKGAVMIIMAAAMIALLGMTAIVIDIANFQQLKRQAQASVDASVLAGALDIGSYPDASAFVQDYANRNMGVASGEWDSCIDDGKDIDVYTIEQSYDCISISEDNLHLRVRLPTQKVRTSFAGIFGFDEFSIDVSATAEVVLATENTSSGPWVDPFDPVTGADYDIREGYAGGGFPQCSNRDELQWVPSDGSTINALPWDFDAGSTIALGEYGTLMMAVREIAAPEDAIGSQDIAPPSATTRRAKGDTTTSSTTTTTDASGTTSSTTTTTTLPPGNGTPGTRWVEAIFVFEHTDGTITVLCTSSAENVDNAGASNIAILWGIGGTDPAVNQVGEAQKAWADIDPKGGTLPQNGMLMHISCSESWKNATQDPAAYPPENGWANPGKGQPIMPDLLGNWTEPDGKSDAVYHDPPEDQYISSGDAEWKVIRAIMVKMVVDADGNNVVDKGKDGTETDRNACPGRDEQIYSPAAPTEDPVPETYIRLSD